MMKLLQRYILSEFLKIFILASSSFIIIITAVNIAERGDDLIANSAPAFVIIKFFLLKIPAIFVETAPMSMLIGAVVSLALLSKHGEITAMKAGGVGLMRASSPLIAAGLAVSAFTLFLGETVCPRYERSVESIKRRWVGYSDDILFGSEGMWFKYGNAIFNIKKAELEKNTLHGVNIYRLSRDFKLIERASAKRVRWENNGWKGEGIIIWTYGANGTVTRSSANDLAVAGLKSPEKMLNAEKTYSNMSISELGRYVKSLERDGFDASKYKTEYYSKFSFPFVNLVMVLVGIPFALRSGHHSGVAAGMAVSIGIGLSYWLVFSLFKHLGGTGILHPLVAAFFPDMLFIAAAALIMGYVKQ